MSDQPKRRGRPPGSKNVVAPEVAVALPVCPKCGSTELRRRPGSRVITRSIPTVDAAGVAYGGIRWIPSRCDTCGQCLTVRQLFNEGVKMHPNGSAK